MNDSMAINFRIPALVRKAGMSALKKELGTVGATYFIRQFSAGHGDYTAERNRLLEGIELDEIIKNVRELDAQNVTSCAI
jgi:transposase-like protein